MSALTSLQPFGNAAAFSGPGLQNRFLYGA